MILSKAYEIEESKWNRNLLQMFPDGVNTKTLEGYEDFRETIFKAVSFYHSDHNHEILLLEQILISNTATTINTYYYKCSKVKGRDLWRWLALEGFILR
jgi:hypothetical protein